MKKFRFHAVALVLFVATTFTSCSDDDNAKVVLKTAFVTTVTGATTADVNQELPLTVTFEVDNLCGVFKKFAETSEATTKTITVEAEYPEENCDTTPTTKTTTYTFKATAVGTYTLKFKKSANEFVTHTVVVD